MKNMLCTEAKVGQVVYLDDGFTCHHAGPVVLAQNSNGVLSFRCQDGWHAIDGQIEGKKLIGLSLTPWKLEP